MNESVGLLVALTAGVLSFLSPCVLPLVPSYLSFVTGMSLEDLQEGVDRKATLLHSLLFVAGFSIIFITLGASGLFSRRVSSILRGLDRPDRGRPHHRTRVAPHGCLQDWPLMRERRVHVNDRPAGYLGNDRRGGGLRSRLDALHWPRSRSDPDSGRDPGHGLGGSKPVERLLVGAGHPVSDFRVGPGLVPGRVLPLPPVPASSREGVRK